MLVDLRSDTVTRPTPAMMGAIAAATVEDAARGADPTVDRLQSAAAVVTGKEAALFVPSGTMGNLTALACHTRPGNLVVCETLAHVVRSERGGMAAVAGVLPILIDGPDGLPDPGAVRDLLRSPNARTRRNMAGRGPGNVGLICIETSHNGRGGVVPPLSGMAAIHELAAEAGIPIHLDGARIFNAAVRLDVTVGEICRYADSVMFCVSKGLGAPIGSLLCGDRDFIERAKSTVKMLGGAMRQSGLMAAAGLVALDEGPARLPHDHDTARRLAETLAGLDPRLVDMDSVQTNIVNLDPCPFDGHAAAFADDLEARGVLIDRRDDGTLRLVTHHQIKDAEIAVAAAALSAAWREFVRDPAHRLDWKRN
ncbi:GntG family PLP-dependent aldolase [Fodinicurvata sp. EGI_FJ10296]|uniref:threonine aldolase family protein n=1 Tax=Fodinicurvata sp. EGI_FJ10296 TaxID=3231908 RepID=UPI00345401B4